MAYLLILPLCLYVILATIAIQRQPRSVSNVALALYVMSAAIGTAADMVMGTTSSRAGAEWASVIMVVAASWCFLAFLPLTLIGLYFENWLRIYQRRVIAVTLGSMILVNFLAFGYRAASGYPMVLPVTSHAWLPWAISDVALVWPRSLAVLLSTQILYVIVVAAALHRQRVTLWRGAVPLTLVVLLSALIPMLSPLAGARWLVTVAALSYTPPVLLITVLLIRAVRLVTLDDLIQTTLQTTNDGLVVIDANQRVVWKNVQMTRWLSAGLPGAVTPPHVLELLRGTPLSNVVKSLLETNTTQGECEAAFGGDEYVLQVELQLLHNVHSLPGARLLLFRDVTALRVRRNLEERRQEILALSAISASISASLEMDQVISRALQQVRTVSRADSVAVYLLDEHDLSTLYLAGSLVLSDDVGPPNEKSSVDNSTKGQVVRTRQTVLVSDAREDAVYGPRYEALNLRAGASVPIMARERMIGVLQVSYQSPHKFDAVEVALLESVGRQLAVALDNARLHRQEREQRHLAEVLRTLAGILANKKLDEALQLVLERLRELLDYDYAAVLLLGEPGQLQVGASIDNKHAPADLQPRQETCLEIDRFPYLKRLFDGRSPQIVSDTTTDSVWPSSDFAYSSWMGVPLKTRDQIWGCLSIAHCEPGRFTTADLQIASTFADHAVVAVESAQLFETEQRRRVQAEQMQRASYDLVTSRDLEGALSAVLRHLSQIITFDQAHIGLIDHDTGLWTFHAAHPPAFISLFKPVPITQYRLILRIVADKRPILVPDTRQNPDWRPGRHSSLEVRSWIGAPLIMRGQVIGLLGIDSFHPNSFLEEHVQIAQTVANQIAAVFQNFRLLDEASRRNRALGALNTVLAASNEALTHENLLRVSLERVLETLNLSGGTIHHYDESARELWLRAVSGLPDGAIQRLVRVPAEAGLTGVSLPPFTGPDGQPQTFFSVPLVSHGTGIGLLSICQKEGETLGPDLQELLTSIGQQLGVVMDNAVLFENATRRVALSTDLGHLSLAISAQLDRDTVLNLICRESITVFGAQGAYIWLIQGDQLVGTAAYGLGSDRFPGHVIDRQAADLLPVRVIKEWRPRYVNSAAGSAVLPPDFLEMTHAQAVIAVPLLKADVPIGTLLLVNTQNPAAFADWLTEQIGLFGVQAALAIQNADLFEEVRRRLDQLRLVNEVGRYSTAILSPSTLVEGVARKLFDLLQYDMVRLFQMDSGQLQLNAVFVRAAPTAQAPEPDSPSRIVATKSVQRTEPVLENLMYPPHPGTPGMEEEFECCTLAVPLIVADEVTGVLVVERRGHNSIVQEDLDVLEPLAAQLAISLSNALLYEKVRRQAIELEARVAQRTAEIRQQQERTEAILRSVADAVIVFDLNGRVVMTNPVARRLFDRHDLDMNLGGRVLELVARAVGPDPGAYGATEIIEFGEVALQAKAARVVEDGDVLGSVVILRDISRLRELDRLKDKFVSTVSHELRTPLANLKLYLSLLQQGRPERHEKYLDVMQREVERLARLIGDLLQISRLQSEQHAERPQQRETIDFEALIETVIHNNVAWADSEHKELLHECVSSPLPTGHGDLDQLVRALTNLVSNAISYTPEGGRIVVRSQVEPAEHAQPDWVIIDVIDTGIGIPARELATIFERFYRGSNVSSAMPGTGLGLAIVKDIVELHGGRIEVESEEGRGSRFRLRLPVSNSKQ
jgi:GAF domain-containing protein/nitrogen-specific signal transduction histidine kinase